MPTVLVVDDEPGVRALIARFLGLADQYTVMQALDGFDAWAVFKRQPDAIDLLLTDVVMPGMPGTELAARVHGVRSELPIILMTGYTPAELMARGLEVSHGRVLTKPFSQRELLGSVSRALTRTS
jgi:CheY-like chemotaxis protein